jgi:hypothetical protein
LIAFHFLGLDKAGFLPRVYEVAEHYSYVYCRSYQDKYGDSLQLIFARNTSMCLEKYEGQLK